MTNYKKKFFNLLKEYHISEKWAKKHILGKDWVAEWTSNGYLSAVDKVKNKLPSFPYTDFLID